MSGGWEVAALVLYLGFLLLAFGLRSLLQKRATGSSGFVGIDRDRGWAGVAGGVLFALALALGLAAPILALAGAVEPIDAASDALAAVGAAIAVGGIALSLYSQREMGTAWRIGVDADERTELVETGLFGLVRNPFFTATAVTAIGLVLIVPSAVAFAGLITLLAAIELQVRVVEEPYLERTHGSAYDRYAARVGRFVPLVGTRRSASI